MLEVSSTGLRASIGMSRHTVLLCLLAALSWSVVTANVLIPPRGYSVGFTGTIRRGVQKYVCKRGSWIKTGASAQVYSPSGAKLGSYCSVYDSKQQSLTYTWNILNSGGEAFESGARYCGIQALPLTTLKVKASAVAEYLALVKSRRGSGDADHVAFVSLTGTSGGLPPRKALCTSDGATSSVPFSGKFTFYTIDRVPPTVPAAITAPGNFVQTLFLQGKSMYRYKNGKWNYIGFFATIAEVAGGPAIGKVGTCAKRDRFGSDVSWQFKAPNAHTLMGFLTRSARMYADGCPWQLLKITSHTGFQSSIGSYKYALIGATYGGNPPSIAARINGIEWGSIFTAQLYMYT